MTPEFLSTLRPAIEKLARRKAWGMDPQDLISEMFLQILEDGETTWVLKRTNDPQGRKTEIIRSPSAPENADPLFSQTPAFIARWAWGCVQRRVTREREAWGLPSLDEPLTDGGISLLDVVRGSFRDPVGSVIEQTDWLEWFAEEVARQATTARTQFSPGAVLKLFAGWLAGETGQAIRAQTGLTQGQFERVRDTVHDLLLSHLVAEGMILPSVS